MVLPPTIFVSGTIAVLQLCQEIYLKYKSVKRYRDDCKQLCHFVSRVEGFLMETEDEEDMIQPGWQTAFSALHESLVEVGAVFEDCAKFGIVRSIVQADEMNLRLSSIAQRMTMALQLIPIQKAKAADKKLNIISELQAEMRTAQFRATRAAEQQSADLKRLMDQSRVDTSKTQEMLAQVILLLQQDRTSAAAVAAADGCLEPDCGPPDGSSRAAAAAAGIQLDEEIKDLQEELLIARKDKKIIEEQYLAQIIAAIESLEVGEPELIPAAAAAAPAGASMSAPPIPPRDLLCPITCELLDDPVLLVDSCQTYERAAIQEWLSRGNTKDPVTGIQLTATNLVPNVLVKKLAREWLEEHPQYRREAAAAAAAAAQYDAALPAQYVVNKTSPAEAGSSSDSKDKPLKGEKGAGGEDFKLNSKAAALLAAVAGDAGSSKGAALSYFDPAMLQTVSSSSTATLAEQPSADVDEKTAAQRAYAAAVAAAAAQEASMTQGVAAFPAVRMSHSMVSRQPHAMTAPRALSHSATVAHHVVPAAAPAGSSVRIDQQQLSAQDEFKLWKQQQEQRDAEEFALWQQQRRRSSIASSSGGLPQVPDLDAVAHYQQQQPEAQDVPTRLSSSQTGPLSGSSNRQLTPEEQYMLQVQQQQQLSQHERDAEAYSLWARQQQPDASQGPQAGRSLQPSATSTSRRSSVAVIRDHALSPEEQLTLEHFRATFKHMAETRAAITLKHGSQEEQQRMQQQLALQEQQQQQVHRAGSAGNAPAGSHDAAALLHTTRSMPPSHAAPAAAAAGSVSAVRAASYPGNTLAPSSSGKSVAASSTGGSSAKSGFGGFFGKKKSSKVDVDDDAASVHSVRSDSSGGTNASKKSVGKTMLGALKNISYTMVYQDDKC